MSFQDFPEKQSFCLQFGYIYYVVCPHKYVVGWLQVGYSSRRLPLSQKKYLYRQRRYHGFIFLSHFRGISAGQISVPIGQRLNLIALVQITLPQKVGDRELYLPLWFVDKQTYCFYYGNCRHWTAECDLRFFWYFVLIIKIKWDAILTL